MFFLQKNLQVFNVSSNHLTSLSELQGLSELTQFLATDNNLTDIKELAHCFSSWIRLWRLELLGNPVCNKSKYRDRLIIMASKLGKLNFKTFVI